MPPKKKFYKPEALDNFYFKDIHKYHLWRITRGLQDFQAAKKLIRRLTREDCANLERALKQAMLSKKPEDRQFIARLREPLRPQKPAKPSKKAVRRPETL